MPLLGTQQCGSVCQVCGSTDYHIAKIWDARYGVWLTSIPLDGLEASRGDTWDGASMVVDCGFGSWVVVYRIL